MPHCKKTDQIASHVLLFLVRSIINPMKFSLANFAATNATSVQLFPLFWKAVGILEENVGMKVVGVTSDRASPNRTMHRMHLHMTCIKDMSVDVDVTYRILNIMAEEELYIYFISDPPHLIKTARNCLANLLAGRCTRTLMVLIFAGTNFREFREFLLISRNKYPRNVDFSDIPSKSA